MGDTDLTYRVLYTKSSTKKRKTYQDGTLLLTSSFIALIGDDGKDVYRKKCHMPKVTSGEEITLGTFELQIEEVVNKSSIPRSSSVSQSSECELGYIAHTSKSCSAIPVPSASSKKSKVDNLQAQQKLAPKIFISKSTLPSYKAAPILLSTTVASSEILSSVSSNLSNTLVGINNLNADSSSRGISENVNRTRTIMSSNSTSSNILQVIALDTALLRVMRPHQIEAANFLIRRLLGEKIEDKCFDSTSDLKYSLVSTSSSSSTDQKQIREVKISEMKRKVKKSKLHPVKGRGSGISRNKMISDSDSDSFHLSDSDVGSNSDICEKNTALNKVKDKRRNNSSSKSISSRTCCKTNIDSDSDSVGDSNSSRASDSDSDGMFVEKPPGYIDEEEKEVVPSGIFTGAILADEVLLFFITNNISNIY